MQIQKLKLGQQSNDEGSINLAGASKKATLKCKKIIIKTLAKLYESVYCHSMVLERPDSNSCCRRGKVWCPNMLRVELFARLT